ncbi:MAG: hypothetical protein RLZZ385_1538 [Pseudomonadota bacterium]|jgi:SAM-dependent methyltransferase
MTAKPCRFCETPLQHVFVDLGMSPLSNSFLTAADLDQAEVFYPLKTWVCSECLLVQLEQFEAPDRIFQDYLYFSSYSASWLEHARAYTEMITARLGLDGNCQVIEIASNDGYLLQYFQQAGIPALGIEPADNVAQVARDKGIDTISEFFGVSLARALALEGTRGDLVLGNNVLAHVPDLNDFVAGLAIVLAPSGVITLEFPHLLQLIRANQFDTIYHEHFSYFSLYTVRQVLARHELDIFDVEELATHGGSLRIYACRRGRQPISSAVQRVLDSEAADGLHSLPAYLGFADQVHRCKRELLRFLIDQKEAGRTVVGYGAPAKGNTLLNYCGVREDLLAFTVDRSPHKQGRFLPGTHIPILGPEAIDEARPDFVLILPWNLQQEIVEQLAPVREWGCRFVVPVPAVQVLP